MNDQEEYIILWEAPKIEPPELRLYYDETGAVICYCGDKSLQGNYIVIDNETFAAARPDVKVINGKISTVAPNAIVQKLMPDDTEGITCATDDMSIIVDDQDDHIKWKLNIYELQ